MPSIVKLNGKFYEVGGDGNPVREVSFKDKLKDSDYVYPVDTIDLAKQDTQSSSKSLPRMNMKRDAYLAGAFQKAPSLSKPNDASLNTTFDDRNNGFAE